MNWLDSNWDGFVLLFLFGITALLVLCFAAIVEQLVLRHRRRHDITHLDLRRCERVGSQDEFERRVQAARGWR